jgi:hypothetical protein
VVIADSWADFKTDEEEKAMGKDPNVIRRVPLTDLMERQADIPRESPQGSVTIQLLKRLAWLVMAVAALTALGMWFSDAAHEWYWAPGILAFMAITALTLLKHQEMYDRLTPEEKRDINEMLALSEEEPRFGL